MLRIPHPRVESIHRYLAGRASPGDRALTRVGPGLLALLEHPVAGGADALGAGYHARYNVPLGLAVSAALAVVEPATPAGSWWVGREATIEWLARAALDNSLCGEARLTALSERDALFSITALTDHGLPLLRGDLLLARVMGGRSVGYPPDAGPGPSLSERARAHRPAPFGLRLRAAPTVLPLGRTADVVVELPEPPSSTREWTISACGPAGGGISVEPPAARTLTARSASSGRVIFSVRADLPAALNDGEPWLLEIRAKSAEHETALTVAIAVPDSDVAPSADPLDVRDETTPTLLAWTAPEPCAADVSARTLRFPVRLLGRGIRVDAAHPAAVTVAAPDGLDTRAIADVTVVQGPRALGAGRSTVVVTLIDRATPIELEVRLTPEGMSEAAARFAATGAPPLRERDEPAWRDLLRLRPPRAAGRGDTYRVTPDLVRLLLNPVAGHHEPLGRRVHPLAGLGVGASLTAAFGLAGEEDPAAPDRSRAAALWIRWLTPPDLELELEARGRIVSAVDGCHTVRVEVIDGAGQWSSDAEVVIAGVGETAESAVAALLAGHRIERASASRRATPSGPADTIARARSRLGDLWRRLSAPGSIAGRETPGS
jgi:hypothetical protein